MKPRCLSVALGVWMLAAAGGCGPAERSWRLLQTNVPEGVMMAGALLADQSAVLVGGQAEAGAAWRLVGAALQTEAVPAGKLLSWASRTADGALLAVGNGRRALWRAADGTWTAEALPAGDELWGCLAWSRDEAWAVGGDIHADGSVDPVVLRRRGGAWSQVALPALVRTGARLFKIDGRSPGDVVAVGDRGLALGWDGAAWREEATGSGENLTTVRALEDGRYVAVGGQSTGVVLLRGTDRSWRKLRDAQTGLAGVEAFGDAVWACGTDGWLERDRLDGTSSMPLRPALTVDSLHWVLRLPSGDGLAGGGSLQVWPARMHGTLLQWAP